MPERANPDAAPGDEMTLRLQLLDHLRRKDDDVGRLAGANQPSRLHAAHRPDRHPTPGPLLVCLGEFGQDLTRRHRRDACDLAGHLRLQRGAAHGGQALNRCTSGRPLASGSRILYMSRPSTPEASLARFSPSFASRAAAASARLLRQRGRHARPRRRRRRRPRRPDCTSAPAQTTGMFTEPSVALTVPLALIACSRPGSSSRSASSRRARRRR